MAKTAEMTVWAQDLFSYDIIPPSFTVFRLPVPDVNKVNARDIFVLTSVADLPTVSEFVRTANQRNHLRTLFVREDDNAQFLPQMLYEAKLKSSRHILVHSTKDVPKRVLTAWSLGCPDQLIADAQVVGEELFVMACDHTLFRVGFAEMPALERIPSQQRSSFTISSEGSYIHWPEVDVHIDLDAIRYLKDETWREKKDRERLMYDLRFGEAVAAHCASSTGLSKPIYEGFLNAMCEGLKRENGQRLIR